MFLSYPTTWCVAKAAKQYKTWTTFPFLLLLFQPLCTKLYPIAWCVAKAAKQYESWTSFHFSSSISTTLYYIKRIFFTTIKNAQVFNRSVVAVLAKCPSHNRIIVSSNPTATNPHQCCPAVLKVSLRCNMPFYNPNSILFQEVG